MGLNKNSCWMGFDKNGVKTPVCFSEPSAYCCGSHFPYESKLSTESPPTSVVAHTPLRKTNWQ
jgi:hypothetical protein